MATMRVFSLLLVLLNSLAWASPAKAVNTLTVTDIEAAARQYLDAFASTEAQAGRALEYTLGGLDPRLQLAECTDDLAVEFISDPQKNTRNTLQVSCAGDRPWRLFLNAEVSIFADTYVAATPLGRGVRITEAMVRQEKVVINKSRSGVYHDLAGLLGMEIRRPVRAGTLLSPALLTRPEAIARGDAVKIEAKSGAIVIETRGTAMTAGRIGEQIAVENTRSGRRVRGVIIAPGHVRVLM